MRIIRNLGVRNLLIEVHTCYCEENRSKLALGRLGADQVEAQCISDCFQIAITGLGAVSEAWESLPSCVLRVPICPAEISAGQIGSPDA